MTVMWIAFALLACGRDCAVEFELVDRDWCYVEQAVEAAERGNLGRSRTLISHVHGGLPQAAAVEGVLTVSPREVSPESTRTWCSMLEAPFDQRCLHNRGISP
jgi:hypothetical protein